MTFPPKDLLDQLADLQLTLEGYSLEKLTVAQALEVRDSFQQFLKVMESFHLPPGSERRAGEGVPPRGEKIKMRKAPQALLQGAGVLCLTGNPIEYGVLGRKLHGLGSRVYLAADSEMFLKLARRKTFNIIIVDADVPLQDMGAAIDQVRAISHPGGAAVPVLVISKNPGSPVKPVASDSGVYAVDSPSDEALFALVSQLIAQHRSDTSPADTDHALSRQQDLGSGDPEDAADSETQMQGFSLAVLEYTGRMRLAIPRGDFSGIADACRILRPHLHQWGAGPLLDFTEDILVSALKGKDLERIVRAQEEFLSLYPLVLKSLDDRAGK